MNKIIRYLTYTMTIIFIFCVLNTLSNFLLLNFYTNRILAGLAIMSLFTISIIDIIKQRIDEQ